MVGLCFWPPNLFLRSRKTHNFGNVSNKHLGTFITLKPMLRPKVRLMIRQHPTQPMMMMMMMMRMRMRMRRMMTTTPMATTGLYITQLQYRFSGTE